MQDRLTHPDRALQAKNAATCANSFNRVEAEGMDTATHRSVSAKRTHINPVVSAGLNRLRHRPSRHRLRSTQALLEQLEPRLLLSTTAIVGIAELADTLTTTGSSAVVYLPADRDAFAQNGEVFPATNTSGPLINHDIFLSDPRFAGIDGTGFSTVIIDTGIDLDHSFFGPDADQDNVADRIVYHHDFSDNDNDATDLNNHGSNVSSIVASSDATYGGMAPGADIIALKVFSHHRRSKLWRY